VGIGRHPQIRISALLRPLGATTLAGMTSRDERPHREPTWTVQGVFDPEVSGQDFSYTIGLHDLGHPELHLWASPTDGNDPGDDWSFSHHDRGRILNEFGFLLIDGRLGPGSRLVRKYDGGLATVTFEVQSPGDREALEALGIRPGASVLPVTWSLERRPVGSSTSLAPEDNVSALREYDVLMSTLPARHPAPPGWELTWPRFSPDQPFGPRTPVVLARAAQLWSTRDVGGWVEAMANFGAGSSLTWPITMARATARPVGRTDAINRLESQIMPLVESVISRNATEWHVALDRVVAGCDIESVEDRLAAGHNVRDWLAQATFAVLSVEAVADVADSPLILAARGPWLAATNPGRALPGPDWSADARVVRAVKKQLRPLHLDQWSEIVRAHHSARDQGGPDNSYNDLCWELYFIYFTGAAGMPWQKLADLPAGRECRYLLAHGQEWSGMVEWASGLAALMSHRARFSAEQVATYASPVVAQVPDLQRILNAVR
jgi:hypothetical protein